jgi:hypothetical protein
MTVKNLTLDAAENGRFSNVATFVTGDTIVPPADHHKLHININSCTTCTLTVDVRMSNTSPCDLRKDIYQTTYPRAGFTGDECLTFLIPPREPVTIANASSVTFSGRVKTSR